MEIQFQNLNEDNNNKEKYLYVQERHRLCTTGSYYDQLGNRHHSDKTISTGVQQVIWSSNLLSECLYPLGVRGLEWVTFAKGSRFRTCMEMETGQVRKYHCSHSTTNAALAVIKNEHEITERQYHF